MWSCPPTRGNEYIFYNHPKDQKTPTAVHLLFWYKNLLEKGISVGSIIKCNELLTQIKEDGIVSVLKNAGNYATTYRNILHNKVEQVY